MAEPDDFEQLEELGDDAIIAQQQGAHSPRPRAQVSEEARSVVISDHPPPGSNPPKVASPSAKRPRSERTEKTLVIRDRRQLEELRRAVVQRKPLQSPMAQPGGAGLLLWVIVGVAAFLAGSLVAFFATRETNGPSAVSPAVALPLAHPSPVPTNSSATAEPPSVSIDELPLENSRRR